MIYSHLIHQSADQFGFKDVSQRNPVEKAKQGLQSGMDQRCILGVFLRQTIRQEMASGHLLQRNRPYCTRTLNVVYYIP